jgi:hypothetical protein
MPEYLFFFSYAHENYTNSVFRHAGKEINYLDEFYENVVSYVSDISGRSRDTVSFRDQDRLRISDHWSPELVEGLKSSHVLLAMISPHYVRRPGCGREYGYFKRRFEAATSLGGVGSPHRIIPVFWIDSNPTKHVLHPEDQKELFALQLTLACCRFG